MAHTFTALHYHLIFSTKQRQPLLTPNLKPRLLDYMGGILRAMGAAPLLLNGPEDHLHVLTSLPATLPLSDALRDLKGDSSRWAKDTFHLPHFAWQTGYAAFSVSKSGLDPVYHYIASQEEHHKTTTFQDEYLKFLHAHDINYDPRFVFD